MHMQQADPRVIVQEFMAGSPSAAERAAFLDAVIESTVASNHSNVFWGDRLLTLDKAGSFLSDEAFRKALQAIRSSHVYDAYSSPHTIAWRLHTLVWAARCALASDGDFVECGVFKGDMAWVVATVLGDAMQQRAFYLYDSFEGFSPEMSRPEDFPEQPGFLAFANKFYRQPGLWESVVARFAGFPHVKIIRGFLPEALEIAMPERISFFHVDLNSPAAEIAVLNVLFERVAPGGMVVFDDYGWQQFHRQREAEDRFMAERGHVILELPTGQGLVVKH
jgi:O-methyltransferase